MKKIAFIALVFIASFANAQNQKHAKQKMQDYTPEERAQLQTKQLTLDLDLNEAQQKQVEALFLENAKASQAKYDLRKSSGNEKASKADFTKEEKLQMKNDRLDRQIEMKKKMKDILNEDQFIKWEKLREEKKDKYQKQMRHQNKAKLSEPKK